MDGWRKNGILLKWRAWVFFRKQFLQTKVSELDFFSGENGMWWLFWVQCNPMCVDDKERKNNVNEQDNKEYRSNIKGKDGSYLLLARLEAFAIQMAWTISYKCKFDWRVIKLVVCFILYYFSTVVNRSMCCYDLKQFPRKWWQQDKINFANCFIFVF